MEMFVISKSYNDDCKFISVARKRKAIVIRIDSKSSQIVI